MRNKKIRQSTLNPIPIANRIAMLSHMDSLKPSVFMGSVSPML